MKFSRRTSLIILLLLPVYAWGIYVGIAWLVSPARDHHAARESIQSTSAGVQSSKLNQDVATQPSRQSKKGAKESEDKKLSFTDYILIVISLLLAGIAYMLWKRRPQSEIAHAKPKARVAKAVSASAVPVALANPLETRLPLMPWQAAVALPFSVVAFLMGLAGMLLFIPLAMAAFFLLLFGAEKMKRKRYRWANCIRNQWALLLCGLVILALGYFMSTARRNAGF